VNDNGARPSPAANLTGADDISTPTLSLSLHGLAAVLADAQRLDSHERVAFANTAEAMLTRAFAGEIVALEAERCLRGCDA
jgi:L-asparaginase II